MKKIIEKQYKRGKCGIRQTELKEFKVLEKVKQLSYPQEWSSYNSAKTKEKTMAMSLLMELSQFIEIKSKPHERGRPAFAFEEKLICMFIYVYSQFSARRSIADMELAKKLKLLERTPHFNSILNMFIDNSMTQKLTEVLEITSLPLKMFEEQLAIDSSGFSTSNFDRWVDIRTQKPTKLRHWCKAHLIIGTKTNIITGITITQGHEADAPQLKILVKNGTKFYEPKEISADKAYLSRANLEAIASTGCVPYIPFKNNSRSNPRGCQIWSAMFKYFYSNQAKFMQHYHMRSNIESTFSMIKRNFGYKLRTRNFTSQINEILMKCICHNLSVLVQESFELGLKIDFDNCAEIYYAHNKN